MAIWLAGPFATVDTSAPAAETIGGALSDPANATEGTAVAIVTVEPASTAEIADRPLFSQTRRPAVFEVVEEPPPEPDPVWDQPEPPPLEPAPPPPPSPRPEVAFLGSISSTLGQTALLRNLETGEEVWLPIGGGVGDWELIEITDTEVVFRLNDEMLNISLRR